MKKLKNTFRLFVTVMLLGGWLLAASAMHVVWTGNKVLFIPKNRLGVRETYVNTVAWSAGDVANHPTLAKRLIDTGHTEVVAAAFKDVSADELSAKINEAISHGPTTKPADVIGDKVEQVVQKTHDVVEHAKQSVDR